MSSGACRVSTTFGLHSGWAIEGALGTEYKVDATYVSPNVYIAEQIEQAAELYGTSVLLTEKTYKKASPSMASKCRWIDQVTVRGSLLPLNLYSLDLNFMALQPDKPADLRPGSGFQRQTSEEANKRWNSRQRFRARQILEAEKREILAENYCVSKAFDCDPDLFLMRAAYTVEFREIFGMGYQNYAQGEWRSAQLLLRRALILLLNSGIEDGPSSALLRYMSAFQFVAPTWWKGVHALEDMPPLEKVRKSRRSTFLGDSNAKKAAVKQHLKQDDMEEIATEEPAMLCARLKITGVRCQGSNNRT